MLLKVSEDCDAWPTDHLVQDGNIYVMSSERDWSHSQSVSFLSFTRRPYKLLFFMCLSVTCGLCFSLLDVWIFYYMNLKVCAAGCGVWQKGMWVYYNGVGGLMSRTHRVWAGSCCLLGRVASELSTSCPRALVWTELANFLQGKIGEEVSQMISTWEIVKELSTM